MKANVSIEMARFFMDQVVGNHNGQMAMIPNSPVLQSMIIASFGTADINSNEFRQFLNGVADALADDTVAAERNRIRADNDFPF